MDMYSQQQDAGSSQRQTDTSVEIVTPENIAFTYLLAGPFRRLPAFFYDCLIMAATLFAAWVGMSFAAYYFMIPFGFGVGVLLVFTFVLSWFYGAFFESVWNGRTPGKWMAGLRVLTIDGQPISAFQAFLRNILRLADLQPGSFGLVGLGVCSLNDRFQRLGDIAAGTMVVVEETVVTRRDLAQFDHPDILQFADRIPPTLFVSPGLTKALALYVHRRKQLPLRRREEIAMRLALPLLQRCGLPTETNPDLFLCAVYHAIFASALEKPLPEAAAQDPFAVHTERRPNARELQETLPPMHIEN